MAKANSKSTRVPPKAPTAHEEKLEKVRRILYDLDQALIDLRNRICTCGLAAAGLHDIDSEAADAMIDSVDSVRQVSDHIIEQVRQAEAQAKSA